MSGSTPLGILSPNKILGNVDAVPVAASKIPAFKVPLPPPPAAEDGTNDENQPLLNAQNDTQGSDSDLTKPPIPGGKVSRSRPPQHKNARSKYVPVKSSGYGRVRSSGYTSDDSDCGSVCSVASVGVATVRDDKGILSSSGIENKSRRRSVSAPSSPSSARKRRDSLRPRPSSRQRERPSSRPNSRLKERPSSRQRERPLSGPSWVQQQRMQQQDRRCKTRSKTSKDDDSSTGSASKSSVNGSVKRTSQTASGVSSANKTKKTSATSTPGSAASVADSTAKCSDAKTDAKSVKSDAKGQGQEKSMTPVSQIKRSLFSTFRSPVGSPMRSGTKRKGIPGVLPLSYSKIVSGTPTPIRDAKNRSVIAELSLFDPKNSEVRALDDRIFKTGSGVSDDEIRKVLNSKLSSCKQWEYKKKLDDAIKSIKNLKDTLNSLMRGKNDLVIGAIEAEKTARSSWARALQRVQEMDNERNLLKKYIRQCEVDTVTLKDNFKDTKRELQQKDEKLEIVEKELSELTEKLAKIERDYTEVCIKKNLFEVRSEEATKQAEGWRAEIAVLEASKAEAIKQAETAISTGLEQETIALRDEIAALRTRMEARDEELGRLVNLGSSTDGGSRLDGVKQELDRLRSRASEAESQLALREAELERAREDCEAASKRAIEKDRDMSELMKGISDIQRSGQEREVEANASRKAAEEKSAELESIVAKIRGENSMLEYEKCSLKESLEHAKAELAAAEGSIHKLKAEISADRSGITSLESKLEIERELRSRAEDKESEERRERVACSAQMVAMTQEHARVEAQLKESNEGLERQWREKLAAQMEVFKKKENELLEEKEINTALEGELTSLKQALNDEKNKENAKSAEEIGRLNGEINVLKERLKAESEKSMSLGQATAEQVAALEAQIREGQAERRRMHNVIQELRGNVRVFARVRPFLPGDGVGGDAQPCITPKNETSLVLSKGDEYPFTFDRVFPPSVGQQSVFDEVSEFVQSALDGYSVCLFSYGQTGSGKTHTMQGSGVGQMRGIIPRAIEQVGQYKAALEQEGWRYSMQVSFLEIYNETIRDLLREDKNTELKHDIKVNSEGRRYVSDLTMRALDPSDSDSVEEVMRQAAKHRSVASTDMNEVSSRSHSVFTLHLTATHSKQKKGLRGVLNLVDLAGSERLDRSGATGDRAKEAVSINKSLSSLTDVFVSIGKKAGHVPFRNSKLTYLLQPCLSGNGKTLMVVNLSPTEMSAQESLCSLRFASQVNKCELGKPKRSIEEVTDSDSENGEGRSKKIDEKQKKRTVARTLTPSGSRHVRRKMMER